jgi:hypothetical protein
MDLATQHKEQLKQVFKFLGNHLIGLSFEYRVGENSEILTTVCSGFIVEIGEEWLLVTAGHIHSEIKVPETEGKIRILRVRILDGFGSQAKTNEGVVFELQDAVQAFVYSKEMGIDVGFVVLRYFYRESLRANGILPFGLANLLESESSQFDGFILMGVLNESVETNDRGMTSVLPQLMSVHKTDNIPPELASEVNRFFGTIPKSNEYKSIKGMSGGPLIGYRRCDENKRHYWIVGLQSGWHRPTHTIAVSPIRILRAMIDQWANQPLDEAGKPISNNIFRNDIRFESFEVGD